MHSYNNGLAPVAQLDLSTVMRFRNWVAKRLAISVGLLISGLMTWNRLLHSSLRAAVGVVLGLHLLWVLTLAVAPALHEQVHPSAEHGEHHEGEGDAGHQCAVTLFLSGACQCTPVAVFTVKAAVFDCPEQDWRELPIVVVSFCSRAILEHAPPRCA